MKKPNLKAPKLNVKRPEFAAGGLPGGSRTTQSLLAAAAVLAVVAGIAALRPPVSPATARHGGAATTAQVERTQLVCPQPRQGLTGSTTLTMFAPGGASATGGSAALNNVSPQAVAPAAPSVAPAPSGSGAPSAAPAADAKLSLAKTGVPATGPADNGDDAPGTFATATGAYAPGFTVTQTTIGTTDSKNQGLSGVSCAPSGTNFWFAGASTSAGRSDYVVLVNSDTVPAVVDLRLYGPQGPIENDTMTGIAVAPGASQAFALNTVANNLDDLAVNVVARSGRVGAFAHAVDSGKGRDWLPASSGAAPTQTIPGLPADLASARLVVAAPGEDDADLKVQISGKNGWFTPVIAGHETIHVKAGMVTAVDLGLITHNSEVGALRLMPSDPAHPTPVIAGLRVDRTKNGKADAAWLAGTDPIGARASIADNRGGGTNLYLTATDQAAKVRVTSSAGSGGGTPATQEVQIPAGATVAVDNPDPAGLNGVYGLTVETLSGGPVVAARMITVNSKDVQMFTIQELHDDHSTVRVPHTADDPGVLLRKP